MSDRDTQDEVYLSFSSEILRILNTNNLTVEQLLQKAGVAGLSPTLDPASGSGRRDVLMNSPKVQRRSSPQQRP